MVLAEKQYGTTGVNRPQCHHDLMGFAIIILQPETEKNICSFTAFTVAGEEIVRFRAGSAQTAPVLSSLGALASISPSVSGGLEVGGGQCQCRGRVAKRALSHGCARRTVLDGFGPSNPTTVHLHVRRDWQVLWFFRGVPGTGLVSSLPLSRETGKFQLPPEDITHRVPFDEVGKKAWLVWLQQCEAILKRHDVTM